MANLSICPAQEAVFGISAQLPYQAASEPLPDNAPLRQESQAHEEREPQPSS